MNLGGVIYIGDRATGKTHLARELTNPNSNFVSVKSLDSQEVQANLYRQLVTDIERTKGTNSVYRKQIQIEVTLSTDTKVIDSEWLDTPGEIWGSNWQTDNPDLWGKFLDSIHDTEGILLILPPYREIIDPSIVDPNCKPDDFPTREQWSKRFDRWIKFFRQDCPKIRHLLLCMNKADLLINIDLDMEAARLAYHPDLQEKNWQEKHEYVYRRYFGAFRPQIDELNRTIDGLSVRCFITSIKNRKLLELPWIYLGSYLGK
jgi:hypothetical protein